MKIFLLVALTIVGATASAQTTSWNNKKCAVVLTYDDAINVDLDNAIPALDSAKLTGTFYLIGGSSVVSNRMEEWRKAAARGHELGNHSLFHPCDGGPGREFVTPDIDLRKYTVSRAVSEIRLTNTLLKAIDGKSERTFAFPCGDLKIGDDFFYRQLTGDFVAARLGGDKMELMGDIDLDKVSAYAIINHSGKYMVDLVKKAMETNSLLVFMFHGVGGGHPLNVELKDHRELVHFLSDHRSEIWIAPMVDVAAYVRKNRKVK